MAGVAGPMTQMGAAGRKSTAQFLIGLLVGELVTALLISIFLGGVAASLQLLLPSPSLRLAIIAVAGIGFGVADLLDRTPHIWRQVPQDYVHTLSPGIRGLIWGADLGLLVTTQKTTSLLWFGLVAAVLAGPQVVVVALVTSAVFGVGIIAVLTIKNIIPRPGTRRFLKLTRIASGVGMIIVVAALAVGLVNA